MRDSSSPSNDSGCPAHRICPAPRGPHIDHDTRTAAGAFGSREYPLGTGRERAVVIPAIGTPHLAGLEHGCHVLLDVLACQDLDVLSLDAGIDLWINSHALLSPTPVLNIAATVLAHAAGVHTVIFGTAIALAVDPTTGETLGLSTGQADLALMVATGPAAAVIHDTYATLGQLFTPGWR